MDSARQSPTESFRAGAAGLAGLVAGLLVCAVIALVALGFAGCKAEHTGSNSFWNGNHNNATYECFSANDCVSGYFCNEFYRCAPLVLGPDAGPTVTLPDPPEVEQEFGPPASGARYVYVALPDQDSVARIDSVSLDVVILHTGDQPQTLAAVPGQDVAVVLNDGSSTVSVLRTVGGEDEILTEATPPHYNRLAVGPLGNYAVAYFELDDPSAQGIGSFQDVSIIRLAAGATERVVNVSVGFRPRQVEFDVAETTAFVITEDGVSLIDLATATTGFIAPSIPLTDDPLGDGDPDEVIVSPDGRYAFARWAHRSAVRSVDLATHGLVDTPLAAPPTDIDLTPSGDRLVAVVRAATELALIEVPGGLGDATPVRAISSPVRIGLAVVTADGSQALAFSNASNEKAVALVDLATGGVEVARLRKGVRAVALAPDGRTALVLHNKLPGDPLPTDDLATQLDKRYGYSIVDLATRFVKLQITDAEPGPFAFAPGGSAAYVVVADQTTGYRVVQSVDLVSFIALSQPVGSHPVQIGPVADTGRIYVSQEHPLGRISFVDVATNQLQTVTGFQLNSEVIE